MSYVSEYMHVIRTASPVLIVELRELMGKKTLLRVKQC